jgi:hypothetical protein
MSGYRLPDLDPDAWGNLVERRLHDAIRAVKSSDVNAVAAILARLPALRERDEDEDEEDLEQRFRREATQVCLSSELARIEYSNRNAVPLNLLSWVRWRDRKPVAGAVTDSFARAWDLFSAKPITRVLKKVPGLEGAHHETGHFAAALKEVFAIFGIEAKTAGQVKLWKRRQAHRLGTYD